MQGRKYSGNKDTGKRKPLLPWRGGRSSERRMLRSWTASWSARLRGPLRRSPVNERPVISLTRWPASPMGKSVGVELALRDVLLKGPKAALHLEHAQERRPSSLMPAVFEWFPGWRTK